MIYPKLSDGTIDWCVMCKHEGSDFYDLCCMCDYGEKEDDPPTCYESKPQTNGDKLRSMSDEELAEYLDGVCHDLWQMFVKDPQKMWLDWLKQEAKYD